ncbi:IclR family transcriptional regulator C-terminal domain-containing protein [Streptomyces sp. NPDC048191]|uniref:IclR family transcriptional regulator n=1 Tax=Streptomyces sp. NPDC048191 TaxID=3155484 RepID=UPI0033C76208
MTAQMASGLRRDLDLLNVLSSQEAITSSGLGVNRIAELSRRQKSQVSRALAGMLQAGLVERDPETLAYRCGWRLFDLAAATKDSHLVHAARPRLERLAASLGRPAYLCALRDCHVTVLLAEPNTNRSRAGGPGAVRVPALSTSAGRVLISEWEESVARRAFAHTPAAPGLSGPDEMLRELRRIRHAGYAHLDGEFHNKWDGIAAPVRDFTARAVAAVSVPVHPDRTPSTHDAVIRATLRCAAQLSHALGHSEPTHVARPPTVTEPRRCLTPGCPGAAVPG